MADKLDVSMDREQLATLAAVSGAFCRAWSHALTAAGERAEAVYGRLPLDVAGMQTAHLGELHGEIEDAARGVAELAKVQGDDPEPWLQVAKRAAKVQEAAAGVVETLRVVLAI